MATNYPTSLDVYYDKVDNVSTVLATSINNLQDAVAALQVMVGINDSTASSTLDYMTNDFFIENTRIMYFWMDSPPTGWSTAGLATNCVVGVKGGTGTWNTTGGTKAGNNIFTDQNSDSHNHRWLYYNNSYVIYFQDSSGNPTVYATTSGVTGLLCAYQGPICHFYGGWGTGSDDEYSYADHHWYTSNDSHNHDGAAGTWRPNAAIGILAKYTGA